MAVAPPWSFEVPDAARWVLAHGCDTTLTAPSDPLDDSQWTRLVEVATHHRLDGLLVHAVAEGALATTDAQAAEVADLETRLTLARMWQEGRLSTVVEWIASEGIDVVVLKGLATATLDYEDAQMRPTSDVDLLVRGSELAAVGRLLEARGAIRLDPDPTEGYAAAVGKGATYFTNEGEIDLHRLLVWGPFGARLDPEQLWVRPRTVEIAGAEFRALGLEEALLHACAHLLILGWRRALNARDVAQLMERPELDVDRLLLVARCFGAEALLAVGIRLTQRELALRVPEQIGSWVDGYRVTARDRFWLRVERPGQSVPGLESLATYLELRSSSQRTLLRRAALNPRPGTWSSPKDRALRVLRVVAQATKRAVVVDHRP